MMATASSAKSSDRASRLLRVGLYDLCPGLLGKGNFAVVRLGIHKLTKTKVAVKIVDKSDLDGDNLKKISREIEIMRKLIHPSVIRLFQVLETDSMIYIVTEFASKGDIFDYLVSHGKMSECDACHVFSQILSALQYCHSHGVVHRDLKVENLLLDADMKIKLADFGFSNYYNEGSFLSTWCGSPPYAAPELFEGKHYSGPKADIWSLGVVLYVLVSGTLPFDGPTLMELRDRVIKCQYRIPFFLSTECEHLLKGLLIVEPEKRLSLVQIARHPWTTSRSRDKPETIKVLANILTRKHEPSLTIQDAIVDCVVRVAGVDRETVIDCVRMDKCNDLAAMYHMIDQNCRDMEREREKSASVVTAGQTASSTIPPPPLSPTSMTPFFSGNILTPSTITEVFNESLLIPGSSKDNVLLGFSDKLLTVRRHTLGPGQQPAMMMCSPAPFQQHLDYRTILPQTNLTQNLPLVSNLPPESFSVKDPHLLKPPAALLGAAAAVGRRASDGGTFYSQHDEAKTVVCPFADPVYQAETSTYGMSTIMHSSDHLELPGMGRGCGGDSCSEGEPSRPESPNHLMVEQYLSSRGLMKRHTIPESPRKRRTGLHTVMEKPPEIRAELVEQIDGRIQNMPGRHLASISPLASPSKQGASARSSRRKGLSTVNEHSLHLADEQRRLSEGSSPHRAFTGQLNSLPSSCDGSPLESGVKMSSTYQSNDSGASFESASSGYMSPHFYLKPPSPSEFRGGIASGQPRRSSDSGVGIPSTSAAPSSRRHQDVLRPASSSHSATSEPMQQLYDEMYNTDYCCLPPPSYTNSRRYSYPNSPVHLALGDKNQTANISHHMQNLKLTQKSCGTADLTTLAHFDLFDVDGVATGVTKWKGSITQGVPSSISGHDANHVDASATDFPIGHNIQHSRSYDETLNLNQNYPSSESLCATIGPADPQHCPSEGDPGCIPHAQASAALSSASPADGLPKPDICVTNVTGDEILICGSGEPMDHSVFT